MEEAGAEPGGASGRASPERRRIPLGAGVVVIPPRGAAGTPTTVLAPFVWTGWRARRESAAGSAPYPGTAVEWDGAWYEVLEIEETDGGSRVLLEPWDPSHTMRGTTELTPESCRRAAREVEEEARRQRSAAVVLLLLPLVGLLPARVQRRMADDWGHRPERGTVLSAAFVLGLSTAGLVSAWAWKAGLPFDGIAEVLVRWAFRLFLVLVYLMVESMARIYCGFSGLVVGSLLGLPFGWLFPGARADRGPSFPTLPAKRASGEGREGIDPVRDRDVVREAPADGAGAGVEVVSLLPKEDWRVGFTGVEVGGVLHALEDVREETGRDGRSRHVFRLRPARENDLFKAWVEHRPDEVVDRWREANRREAETRVETWAHLWGLLDEPTQLALGRGYAYDPWARTWATIVVEGVVGALNLLVGLGGVLGEGSATSGMFFALGVLLVWEALVRWGRYRRGSLHPSLAAPLVAPFVREAVRWAPPPAEDDPGAG